MRFCGAFLDQGLAAWPLPARDEGFFRAFVSLYRRPGGPPARWRAGLAAELARLEDEETSPLESIRDSLEDLGVGRDEWEPFIAATLLALRGWAGMVRQIEERGDRVVRPVPREQPGRVPGCPPAARPPRPGLHGPRGPAATTGRWPGCATRSAPSWRSPGRPASSSARSWSSSSPRWRGSRPTCCTGSTGPSGRRCWRRSRPSAGWSVAGCSISPTSGGSTPRPSTRSRCTPAGLPSRPARRGSRSSAASTSARSRSAATSRSCAPDAETFGTAGFFSVAIYYRGAADAHFVPLCPAVIRPRHWVVERVRRQRSRRTTGAGSGPAACWGSPHTASTPAAGR